MKNNRFISTRTVEYFCLALGCSADEIFVIIDEPDNPIAADSPFRDTDHKKHRK